MRLLSVLCLAALAVAGCRAGEDTPRGIAERFLDQHYVLIDLEAAKRYCTGLALHKVEEEQGLVGDQVIDDSTQRPKVSYELGEERSEDADHSTFIYNGTVQIADGESFALRWLINTRRDSDGWRVSNFKEFQ